MRTKFTVAVSMDEADKKAVDKIAEKLGISFSAALRVLIRYGMEAWGKEHGD